LKKCFYKKNGAATKKYLFKKCGQVTSALTTTTMQYKKMKEIRNKFRAAVIHQRFATRGSATQMHHLIAHAMNGWNGCPVFFPLLCSIIQSYGYPINNQMFNTTNSRKYAIPTKKNNSTSIFFGFFFFFFYHFFYQNQNNTDKSKIRWT
jgi:hypothetical protein